ncbi:HD domain-containing protein [Luteolibacter luteus]|uniref:HD domain-containing protein n=1 Tax=Luteolibacter luteus TaxID=2728835 RepID=A0A858RFI2_9BACT|nr:HD domain-containing protein [Luteolibacter luteus]QJE95475.1 HD domain-containing protein [Luteolibacter luteus]
MPASVIPFILECEKLKAIERRTYPAGFKRRENSAEHSWSLALLAMTLIPKIDPSLDTLRILKMLILHDIVEIDAGDTFCYADQGDKAEREKLAAQRIFGMLPADLCAEFTGLWEEFEEGSTMEAAFANAMDRAMPLLQNHANQGLSWIEHGVSFDQVMARNGKIGNVSAELWKAIRERLDEAMEKGWLKKGDSHAL